MPKASTHLDLDDHRGSAVIGAHALLGFEGARHIRRARAGVHDALRQLLPSPGRRRRFSELVRLPNVLNLKTRACRHEHVDLCIFPSCSIIKSKTPMHNFKALVTGRSTENCGPCEKQFSRHLLAKAAYAAGGGDAGTRSCRRPCMRTQVRWGRRGMMARRQQRLGLRFCKAYP